MLRRILECHGGGEVRIIEPPGILERRPGLALSIFITKVKGRKSTREVTNRHIVGGALPNDIIHNLLSVGNDGEPMQKGSCGNPSGSISVLFSEENVDRSRNLAQVVLSLGSRGNVGSMKHLNKLRPATFKDLLELMITAVPRRGMFAE